MKTTPLWAAFALLLGFDCPAVEPPVGSCFYAYYRLAGALSPSKDKAEEEVSAAIDLFQDALLNSPESPPKLWEQEKPLGLLPLTARIPLPEWTNEESTQFRKAFALTGTRETSRTLNELAHRFLHAEDEIVKATYQAYRQAVRDKSPSADVLKQRTIDFHKAWLARYEELNHAPFSSGPLDPLLRQRGLDHLKHWLSLNEVSFKQERRTINGKEHGFVRLLPGSKLYDTFAKAAKPVLGEQPAIGFALGASYATWTTLEQNSMTLPLAAALSLDSANLAAVSVPASFVKLMASLDKSIASPFNTHFEIHGAKEGKTHFIQGKQLLIADSHVLASKKLLSTLSGEPGLEAWVRVQTLLSASQSMVSAEQLYRESHLFQSHVFPTQFQLLGETPETDFQILKRRDPDNDGFHYLIIPSEQGTKQNPPELLSVWVARNGNKNLMLTRPGGGVVAKSLPESLYPALDRVVQLAESGEAHLGEANLGDLWAIQSALKRRVDTLADRAYERGAQYGALATQLLRVAEFPPEQRQANLEKVFENFDSVLLQHSSMRNYSDFLNANTKQSPKTVALKRGKPEGREGAPLFPQTKRDLMESGGNKAIEQVGMQTVIRHVISSEQWDWRDVSQDGTAYDLSLSDKKTGQALQMEIKATSGDKVTFTREENQFASEHPGTWVLALVAYDAEGGTRVRYLKFDEWAAPTALESARVASVKELLAQGKLVDLEIDRSVPYQKSFW